MKILLYLILYLFSFKSFSQTEAHLSVFLKYGFKNTDYSIFLKKNSNRNDSLVVEIVFKQAKSGENISESEKVVLGLNELSAFEDMIKLIEKFRNNDYSGIAPAPSNKLLTEMALVTRKDYYELVYRKGEVKHGFYKGKLKFKLNNLMRRRNNPMVSFRKYRLDRIVKKLRKQTLKLLENQHLL